MHPANLSTKRQWIAELARRSSLSEWRINRQRNSPAKNRMREICTSGSVGGEGGNILTYPAASVRDCWVS